MVKVRLTRSKAYRGKIYNAGDDLDVDADVAKRWRASGVVENKSKSNTASANTATTTEPTPTPVIGDLAELGLDEQTINALADAGYPNIDSLVDVDAATLRKDVTGVGQKRSEEIVAAMKERSSGNVPS